MNFFIRIFLIIFSSLSLYACGGGGGGGSGASGGGGSGGGGGMSASSPIAINFTETLSATRGLVSTYRDNGPGANPDTHAEEIGFTSELVFGGFNWYQNADTDAFGLLSDTLYSDLDLNVHLTPAYIAKGPTTQTYDHTLTTTNYRYDYYDSSISETVKVLIMIPSNYPNQTWVYWDNKNHENGSSYNYAVTGKPLAYASIPSSGTATYRGGMEGMFSNTNSKYNEYNGNLVGQSDFTVDWSTETISGSFTNITETVGNSTYGFNSFTMPLTSIVSGLGGIASFEGDLEGVGFTYAPYNAIYGAFFGSSAESIGGTWEVQNDGATGSGAGYFAAKKR